MLSLAIYQKLFQQILAKSNLVVAINYDKNKLKAEMEKIAKEIDVDVKDATLDISGEKSRLYQILMVLNGYF